MSKTKKKSSYLAKSEFVHIFLFFFILQCFAFGNQCNFLGSAFLSASPQQAFEIFRLQWTPVLEHHIHTSGKGVVTHSLVLSNKYHLSLRSVPPALEPVTAREGDETKNWNQPNKNKQKPPQQQKSYQRQSKKAIYFHIDNNRNWKS